MTCNATKNEEALFIFCSHVLQKQKSQRELGKVNAEWPYGEREWEKEVQQVIIEKTKTPLSQA